MDLVTISVLLGVAIAAVICYYVFKSATQEKSFEDVRFLHFFNLHFTTCLCL